MDDLIQRAREALVDVTPGPWDAALEHGGDGMTIDHDAIAARVRQNREAGTPGPWALSASGYNVMRGKTAATVAVAQPSDFSLSDARRISALPDLEAAYLALYDEVKRLRAALTIYAQSGNWRLGGCCDPNSPNFTGEAIARAALKGDSDE